MVIVAEVRSYLCLSVLVFLLVAGSDVRGQLLSVCCCLEIWNWSSSACILSLYGFWFLVALSKGGLFFFGVVFLSAFLLAGPRLFASIS